MENTNHTNPKLVLIDGHSLAFRAFHALPANLATKRGELTNAVFGFASMLLTVLRENKPAYIAITFDVGKTFRHERYPHYKANRAKTPDEMIYQLERIQQIVEAFRIPVFTLPGYEADDVLGTLSRQAEAQGIETLIVTGDTDAFQLVSDRVRVLTCGRRFSDTVIYDERAIQARYGLSPAQLIDYKALVGDRSDNVPGVAGIGEKTAAALLQQYGSLDGIYAHLDEIANQRVAQALREQREQAFLSRELVSIVRDAPIQLDLNRCKVSGYDREAVINLFRELEFRSLLERLPPLPVEPAGEAGEQLALFAQPPSSQSSISDHVLGDYAIVTDAEMLDKLTARWRAAPTLAFDTETTSLSPILGRLVGLSVTDAAGQAVYLPVGHSAGQQLTIELVREKVAPLLLDAAKAKIAHNAIYDLIVLRRHGLEVAGPLFDTMIAQWLIDPASRSLALKTLAAERLSVDMTPISELIGSGKQQSSMADVPIERAGPYAAADADMTMRLFAVLEQELKDKRLWPLFTEVEMPLVPVLADMELTGVKVDAEFLARMSAELEERMHELERKIQDTIGYNFNVRSNKQLSEALFVHLKLPVKGLKKTANGEYSVAAEVLENLREAHPVIDMILEHRQLAKLKSTYIDTLPALINPATGRIHTSLNQTGTVTGRISSSDPNLQNIPIRTPLGRRVREAFIAEDGWRLLSVDYSQVELRILAHISEDPAMLAAFARGEDIHAYTASAIFRVPLEQVSAEMRRIAKTTNFAIVYGVTGYGLSQQTSLSQSEANEFIRAYFQQYPQVKAYLDRSKAQAAELGYVETLLGRRRYFPELLAGSKVPASLRAAAERMAINMPIQGTAADIIKIAMIRLYKELTSRRLRSRMLLQVHDELLLEVPEDEMDRVPDLVQQIMENAYELKAPLKVERKAGYNWGVMSPC